MKIWKKIPYEKIVVIAAHPDDEALGCGGTILKAISEGKDISIIFMTDGSKSPFWREKEHNIYTRFMEVKRIYRKRKIRKIFMLGFEDYALSKYKIRASEVLKEYLKILEPEVVFTHYPDDHPDHRATFEIVSRLKDDFDFELFLFKVKGPRILDNVRVAVDISDFYNKKLKLIYEYRSQLYLTIPIMAVNILEDFILSLVYGKKLEVFL